MNKSLEQQLFEQNQRGALCSGLSHEIYQALSAIRASSGLLRQAMDKESPQACGQLGWVFENIDQSTLRLSRVAENLQDLLQAERGTLAPRLEALELAGQYSEAMELLQNGARLYGVDLQWECDLCQPVFLSADSDWADKILLHLVTNAVLCSERGQTVKAALHLRDQALELTVEDQGPGLPDWVKEHLFEAFVGQYDPMGEGAAAGAGLGLYLVHMYTQAMGWKLELSSSQQGTKARLRRRSCRQGRRTSPRFEAMRVAGRTPCSEAVFWRSWVYGRPGKSPVMNRKRYKCVMPGKVFPGIIFCL